MTEVSTAANEHASRLVVFTRSMSDSSAAFPNCIKAVVTGDTAALSQYILPVGAESKFHGDVPASHCVDLRKYVDDAIEDFLGLDTTYGFVKVSIGLMASFVKKLESPHPKHAGELSKVAAALYGKPEKLNEARLELLYESIVRVVRPCWRLTGVQFIRHLLCRSFWRGYHSLAEMLETGCISLPDDDERLAAIMTMYKKLRAKSGSPKLCIRLPVEKTIGKKKASKSAVPAGFVPENFLRVFNTCGQAHEKQKRTFEQATIDVAEATKQLEEAKARLRAAKESVKETGKVLHKQLCVCIGDLANNDPDKATFDCEQ